MLKIESSASFVGHEDEMVKRLLGSGFPIMFGLNQRPDGGDQGFVEEVIILLLVLIISLIIRVIIILVLTKSSR